MDKDVDMVALQCSIEKEYRDGCINKIQATLQGHKDKSSEYNTSYGGKAIAEMIAPLREFLNYHINYKQTQWPFMVNVIRPAVEYEKEVGISKDGIVDWLVNTTAVNLVANMTSRITLPSLLRTLTNTYYRYADQPVFEDEAEQIVFDNSVMQFFEYLIDEVCKKCGIFKIEMEYCPETRKDKYYISLTEEWDHNVQNMQRGCVLGASSYAPMIIPPKPHTDLISGEGGYYTERSPLLRSPIRVNGKIEDNLKNYVYGSSGFANKFFDELNRRQEIPFQVNRQLLDIILEATSRDMYFKDFPLKQKFRAEHYKEVADTEIRSINKENLRKAGTPKKNGTLYDGAPISSWTVGQIHNKYKREGIEEVHRSEVIIEMAKEFVEYDKIYFPLFLDDRARIYTSVHTGSLSPMGGSLPKSLLYLADKEVFEKRGVMFMYDTLANAIGYDKLSIKMKRPLAIQFWNDHYKTFLDGNYDMFFYKHAEEMTDEIVKHNEFVDTLDDPINCLAICMELVNYTLDKSYKSGYIAHRDARCSGPSIVGTLMHDGFLMRSTSILDEVMYHANKLPDLYSYVAMKGGELNTDEYLQEFFDLLFGRKAFKTAVMTRAAYGCSESTIHQGNRKLFLDHGLDMSKCPVYTKTMMKCIDTEMASCEEFKKTTRKAAGEVLDRDGYVKTISPITGFPMLFLKRVFKTHRIRADINGKKVKLVIKNITDKLDREATLRAVSPGFIHHFDACLLIMVGSDLKIPMATIHDSVGCHPNHCGEVIRSYAKAMSELATSNYLEELYQSMDTSIAAPYTGTITHEDIEAIKHSIHCLT